MVALLDAPESKALRRTAPRLRWRYLWRVALFAVVVYFCHEVGRRLFGANFHSVIVGKVYRGAQPSGQAIRNLASDHGVQTIINLRGCGLPTDWYAAETRAAQKANMDEEDVCLSPHRLPSATELRRLVEILDQANYPAYLHCRRGADRTGLASVVVKLLQPGTSLAEARGQLGLWYAHVALGRTRVLDKFFDLYEAWLAKTGRQHDTETFRHWLLEEYHGGWCSAHIEEFAPLAAQASMSEPLGYRVRVRNTGPTAWQFHAGSLAGVHLGYQVWDGPALVSEGRAGMFDRQVPPGEAITVTLVVPPLWRTGRFRFVVDMVEEGHCWFYQAGSEPHEEELVVVE